MRKHLGLIVRILFVAVCVAGLILSFRGHGREILDALERVSVPGVGLAVAATLAGLAAGCAVWMRVAAEFGVRIPTPQAASIYFASQLGKYLPGSVWSIGAQAHLAAAFKAKPRVTAASGLVTLGYFVGTGALVSTALTGAGLSETPWPRWINVVVAVAAAASLTPPVVNRAARVAAGVDLPMGWRDAVSNVLLCCVMWAAWSVGVAAPFGDFRHLIDIAGAFGLCYAVGVLIVIAPAGLGPREALLITLLTPVMSAPHAAAVALVSRLVHATADITAAAVTWAWSRRTRITQPL